MKTESNVNMTRALEMVFSGAKVKDAAAANGLASHSISTRMSKLKCQHPHCTEMNPCRSSKRMNAGRMICTILTDVDFIDHDCPFFKTEEQFKAEFKATNRKPAEWLRERGYL